MASLSGGRPPQRLAWISKASILNSKDPQRDLKSSDLVGTTDESTKYAMEPFPYSLKTNHSKPIPTKFQNQMTSTSNPIQTKISNETLDTVIKAKFEEHGVINFLDNKYWKDKSVFIGKMNRMTNPDGKEYPCLSDISIVVKLMLESAPEDQTIDFDELVYDAISCWDKYFEDDEDWISEDDNDMKDSLRDEFLEWFILGQV